ncbi:MAG: hypothetical protein MI861_00830, partial [Pirellulales bacterium]|nr:hypothetical protein [Pirellulales bacterium]
MRIIFPATHPRALFLVAMTAVLSLPVVLVKAQNSTTNTQPRQLQFTFAGTPWRDVFQWLAEADDLALHIDDLPLGSFTYTDPKQYTHEEAVDRINLFLIPQRYTLIRSEKLLSLVRLDDQTSVRKLDSLARMVTVDDLKGLASHDFVKCLFPLENIPAEQALEELRGLLLMRDPVVMNNTNQLLIMDTAAKLQTVAEVLGAMQNPTVSSGPVKQFPLGNLDPESTLAQLRPHVGLDPLAMIGADIRLSIDKDRRVLFASGSSENLQAIGGLLALLRESPMPVKRDTDYSFRPYDVGGADLQMVINVLQTLLAEEDVRLAADAGSNLLAIDAKSHVHEIVARTIEKLTGTDDALEFKVLETGNVDARYAAIVLHDMFVAAAPTDQAQPRLADLPVIDADSTNGRLFIRARKSQLAEMERALSQLARPHQPPQGKLRLLPYRGESARQLLESATRLWPYEDRIQIIPSAGDSETDPIERAIHPLPDTKPSPGDRVNLNAKVVASQHDGPPRIGHQLTPTMLVASVDWQDDSPPDEQPSPPRVPEIRVLLTPRGLLVHSADNDSLQRFVKHLELIGGDGSRSRRRLAVFYLTNADVAEADGL